MFYRHSKTTGNRFNISINADCHKLRDTALATNTR